MIALGNTQLGNAMSDAHIQVYGWINGGGNLSTNNVKPGGNAPAAYDYSPTRFSSIKLSFTSNDCRMRCRTITSIGASA